MQWECGGCEEGVEGDGNLKVALLGLVGAVILVLVVFLVLLVSSEHDRCWHDDPELDASFLEQHRLAVLVCLVRGQCEGLLHLFVQVCESCRLKVNKTEAKRQTSFASGNAPSDSHCKVTSAQ
jgi:hypothetical protein